MVTRQVNCSYLQRITFGFNMFNSVFRQYPVRIKRVYTMLTTSKALKTGSINGK